MSAVLDNASDRDSRMVERGESHKPSMVAIFLGSFVFFDAHTLGFLDNLGGAGFTGNNDIVEPGGMSSAIAGVDNPHHAGANLVERRLIDVDTAADYRREDFDWRAIDRVDLFNELRLIEDAAIADLRRQFS